MHFASQAFGTARRCRVSPYMCMETCVGGWGGGALLLGGVNKGDFNIAANDRGSYLYIYKNETPKTHSRRDFTKLANIIKKTRIPHDSLWSEDCTISF